MFRLSKEEIRGRIMRGERIGLTPDHMQKFAAELTKRQHNEAGRELLGALVGGIAKSLATPKEPKQIEGAEVIEAEATEE
jgi:hypothetical protein